jgi:hypothetical protein
MSLTLKEKSMAQAKSKSQKVREYFTKNPLASPKEVGARFKCAMPVVYKIRGEVNSQITDAVTQVEPRPFKPSNKADDLQVGGDHYKNMGVQPWKAMECWMTPEEFRGFLKGNAIKYLARSNTKGGAEDVKKAGHYISKLTEVMGDA